MNLLEDPKITCKKAIGALVLARVQNAMFYMTDTFRPRFILRRYEAILIGSTMLLSGAVMPSHWELPVPSYLYPPAEKVTPPPPQPVIQPIPSGPMIALTFDDGPHPVMTERLLTMLHENHAPGTFFVVGKMASKYPDVLRDMVRQGNEVANHTYNHPNLSRISDEEVLKELTDTREVIQRVTGRDTVLFRPPGGSFSRHTISLTQDAGYRMVLWSVVTNDVIGATKAAVRRRILNGAKDGGIVLMHSGMPNTLEVLPGVISELRHRGFRFVTVSTLLSHQKEETLRDRILHTVAHGHLSASQVR